MGNEIKIGEYARNRYGEIGIVTKTYPRLMWKKIKNPSLLDFNEIVKHSPNIIYLIEEGDYVNGKLIEDIINYKIGDTESRLLIYNKKDMKGTNIRAGAFYEDDIKSVVTKESFKAIEYDLEERNV